MMPAKRLRGIGTCSRVATIICEKSSTITPFPQMPGVRNALITHTTQVISGDAAVHVRIHHH